MKNSQESTNMYNTRVMHFDAPAPPAVMTDDDRDWMAKVKANGEMYRLECEAARKPANRRGSLAKYGLTPIEFEVMSEIQDEKCAICGKDEYKMCVDHCHKTGVVRGLLCARCNSGIGFFKDNVESLKNAIIYLEQHARSGDGLPSTYAESFQSK